MERKDCTTCRVSIHSFAEELSIQQYARAVFRMFDKYIYAHSKEKYADEWRHPYPSKEIEILRRESKAAGEAIDK